MLRGRARVRRPAASCRSTATGCARPPGASATPGITSVAIAAVFSPLNAECETRGGGDPAQECPDAAVTLSHELGRIGLLERENVTLLNAAWSAWRGRRPGPSREALRASGIDGAALPDAERRHRDARRPPPSVPGLQLRLRPDQQHARGGVPLRPGATRWSSTSAAPRRDVGSLATAFRARRTTWWRSAACARCSACPTCCRRPRRRHAGRRDEPRGRAAQRRLPAEERGARLRRRHADRDRRGRGGRPGRPRRPRRGCRDLAGARRRGAGAHARDDRGGVDRMKTERARCR